MKKSLNLLPLLITLGASGSSFASFSDVEPDFFDMSIEQLLQVETKVAGFSSESILSAPSIVSVFTQQDLLAFGVANVYDLMNLVPGFQADRGEFISGHKKLQSRGVYLDSGYVLVMVDGIRVNEMSFGKASVYTPYLDLALAERVEIIRGPGSALYGSNAFLGVINIISRKDNSLALHVGQDAHRRFTSSLSKPFKQGELSVNLAMNTGDGQDYQLPMANDLSEQTVARPYEHQEFGVRWQSESLDLSYRIDRHRLDEFVNLEGYHPDNYFESQNQYLHLAAKKQWSKVSHSDLSLEWADHAIESAGYIFGGSISPQSQDFINGPYWATDRITLNASFSYILNANLSYDLGMQWQKERQYKAGVVTSHITDDGQSSIPLDPYFKEELVRVETLGDFASLLQDIESAAVYGQLKWQINAVDTLHLGARYEDYRASGSAFSPRITYVHRLDNNSQLKAIYSEAFRAPVTNELYSNDGVTLGNPELEPELVKTAELQYFFQAVNWSTEITGFHTALSELIASKTLENQGGRTQFVNQGSETVYGIETLVNYNVNPSFKIRATATKILSDTVEASYDAFASLSLFYQMDNWHTSVNTLWRPAVDIDKGLRLDQDGKVFEESSQLVLNANVRYQLGKHMSLRLGIENLTDETYRTYEPRQDKNQYGVPQAGRHVSVGLQYQF